MRVILDLKNAPLNLALGVAGAVALAAVSSTVIPFADVPLPELPAVGAMACTAMGIFNGLVALLLLLQFQESRRIAIALLAGAYVYGAGIAVLRLLVWPGTLYNGYNFEPGEDVRLWILLYCGNPLLIAAALNSTNRSDRFAGDGPMGRKMWNFLALGLPLALAFGLALLAAYSSEILPSFLEAQKNIPPAQSPIAYLVLTLNFGVLTALVVKTRLRQRLELFLALAIFASFLALALSLLGSETYTVGWYMANLVAVIASATLLTALLWEVHVLYAAMHKINMNLRSELDRDRLTGVFTRKYLEERLRVAFRRAQRREQPLAVMFCDVDHFKQYNDSQGHQEGDACLMAVAGAMAEQLNRKGQFLARYGGDEFVAVLPGLEPSRVSVVAENLRRSVEKLRLRYRIVDEKRAVTVSIGVACMNERMHFESAGDLVRAADQALYESKRLGKNQTRGAVLV